MTALLDSTTASPSRLLALLDELGKDGKDFELLSKWFLTNDPVWRSLFRKVWLWGEWPDRWGPDRGIDLVAEGHDGRIFAIQAKNYSSNHSITKRDIDTFLSESNRPLIDERLLIATSDRVAKSALDVMGAQEKPVTTCLLEDLFRSDLSWPSDLSDLGPQELSKAEPRPHQKEALDAISTWAKSEQTRGQIIMACGTGKSLISVWAADQLEARDVLVLVPTLQLLRQTTRTWTRHAGTERRLVMVCGKGGSGSDIEELSPSGLEVVQTTSPSEIAKSFSGEHPLLMVGTYNSSPAIARAMKQAAFQFDLAVADEAHRCAGVATSSHKTILHDEAIAARRRLFFTATPTVYGTRDKGRAIDKSVKLASMDDRTSFGPVVHKLTFAEAIEQELLVPYQVAVIPVSDITVHQLIENHRIVTPDGDEYLDAASLAAQVACARAMKNYGCRRMVAFQPSIGQSKRFVKQVRLAAQLLPDGEAPELPLWSEHVDGSGMAPSKRARLIQRYLADEPSEHRLLSNVRLLAEGVDIPAIDAVAFVDTRRGQAQVIQAVGRAVRRSPGKDVGTIVLPVITRDGESLAAALTRSEHQHIVDILRAIRSHDPEIIRSLDELRFSSDHPDIGGSKQGSIVVDAPIEVGEEFAEAVGIALADALGAPRPRTVDRSSFAPILEASAEPTDEEAFKIGLNQIKAMARFELLPHVPDSFEGFPIGSWWEEAKKRWRNRDIDDDAKWIIGRCVSWLAPDLEGEQLMRSELQTLTDANVAEQCLAQLREGGLLYGGELELLSESSLRSDSLVDPFNTILDAVTHVAMDPDTRVEHLVRALVPLAEAVAVASKNLDDDYWAWDSRCLAAVEGFISVLELETESQRGDDAPTGRYWRKDSEPEAFEIGEECARSKVLPHTKSLGQYRFRGDKASVEYVRRGETFLDADDRLDELGWEIFLLAVAGGADVDYAAKQGMDGTFHKRTLVRDDFLQRAAARSLV